MGTKTKKEKDHVLYIQRYTFETEFAEMFGRAPTDAEVEQAADLLKEWIFQEHPSFIKEALKKAKEE